MRMVTAAIIMACITITFSSADEPEREEPAAESATTGETCMPDKIIKTDEEWRQELSPMQYRILRQAGTERPFSGKYYRYKAPGVYHCAACGQELFTGETKYESGSGWPSFYQPVDEQKVKTREDGSGGMQRTEVQCGRCESHLGHVFDDGPEPTGLRYCINSAALKFEPEK